MVTAYDVDPSELIAKAAEALKKDGNIKPPAWAPFVKTGMNRERPPAKSDWWYMRAGSVMRTVYRFGPVGVSKLRTKYGGRKNRGHSKEHFYRGSGNILRKILQQLEKSGYIKQAEKGVHKGRVLTPKGVSFLDKIASQLYKHPYAEKKPTPSEQQKPDIVKKAAPAEAAKAQPVKPEPAKKPAVKVQKAAKPAEPAQA